MREKFPRDAKFSTLLPLRRRSAPQAGAAGIAVATKLTALTCPRVSSAPGLLGSVHRLLETIPQTAPLTLLGLMIQLLEASLPGNRRTRNWVIYQHLADSAN
jgi:hypothetical protein